MQPSRIWAGAVLALAPLAAAMAQDQDTQTLERRLEAQEQRLRVLERQIELKDEADKVAASGAPIVKAGSSGLSIQSADGNNVLKIRGTLHIDGRWYADDVTPETADTFLLRRVRPTIEGTLGRIYDFRFTPDFGGGKTIILDAYAAARLRPWATITAGKFKVPVGLERVQSANDIRFVERALPTSLVPNRDIGVQLGGDLAGGAFSYSVGYFNGVTDGSSSDGNPSPDVESDTKGDFAARIFVQPFLGSDLYALRGLGFGIGATYVDVAGDPATANLASYKTPGQQTFFRYRSNNATGGPSNATYADGERLRWAPQVYYSNGPVSLLGEYVKVAQGVSRQVSAITRLSDTLDTSAWQVQLAWFLTGEEEAFKGLKPQSTFLPGKPGWGAFELVARIHQLTLDEDAFAGGANSFANPVGSARKATAVGVGLNWYFNQNVKWVINYEVTRFDGGGATAGTDRADEKAILTRLAVGF